MYFITIFKKRVIDIKIQEIAEEQLVFSLNIFEMK